MIASYIKLAIAALLPVLFAAVVYLLDKKTALGKLNYKLKQVLIGILFGILAVVGTEWGIPLNGAQANCRDAAVLTAGLMFGAPAGIIAGLIGGIERWFAVYWGIGSFTRIACTVSTVFAGFYAAALRKYMFEDKKPGFLISLAVGIVMEVLHLTMVFVTNMATPAEAMQVVQACTGPMVIANGVSVMLSSMCLSVLSRERIGTVRKGNERISQTIQKWLLLTVVLAFVITSVFVFGLQNTIANTQADNQLAMATDEVAADIRDASDANLLDLTWKVTKNIENGASLERTRDYFNVTEISLINSKGVIVRSTDERFVGLDMASGEQSAEFLCLLGDTEEYVQPYQPITYDKTTMRKYAGVKFGSGFVQVGYDAERFQEDIDQTVVGITKNRHVGETGYVLILDEQHNVVSAPPDYHQTEEVTAQLRELPEENTTFSMNIDASPVLCRYRVDEGYYILSVLPKEEAMQTRNTALYVNTFMEILVFAALFFLIYLLIRKVVVNRIGEVNKSLAKITGGNLDEVVNVRSNVEFASLSDDINSTVDTLKRYIAEASARIDKELEFAKNIQSSALPNVFPAFPKRKDFDIYAIMDPAKEVGGDFYDFYITHEDTLHFLAADVSGKGIPAAMFMMRAKTELKSLTEADVPLGEVYRRGNIALYEGNDAGMFVTAWQGSVDLTNGRARYVNAGHNPPLVRRADGQFEYLKSRSGLVLGAMESMKYSEKELQLSPGDILFVYTDGVTEATDANGQLFGEERLLETINSVPFTDMQSLCKLVKQQVDAFVGEAPQFDDITMVALRYFGTPPAPSISREEARIEDIPEVTAFVEAELEKIDCPMKSVIQLNVAVDEIYSNIVKYAYPKRPGPVKVELIHKEDPEAVWLRFTDEGIPYNPLTKEDPDVTLSAEERSIGGLGIYMVKKTMDEMHYAYENEKNILTIKKMI